jgi:hypothetical protein
MVTERQLSRARVSRLFVCMLVLFGMPQNQTVLVKDQLVPALGTHARDRIVLLRWGDMADL